MGATTASISARMESSVGASEQSTVASAQAEREMTTVIRELMVSQNCHCFGTGTVVGSRLSN
jgi:hypothetical protein